MRRFIAKAIVLMLAIIIAAYGIQFAIRAFQILIFPTLSLFNIASLKSLIEPTTLDTGEIENLFKAFMGIFAAGLVLIVTFEFWQRLREYLPEIRPDPKAFLASFLTVTLSGLVAQILMVKSLEMNTFLDLLLTGIVFALCLCSLLLLQRYPSRIIPIWIRFISTSASSTTNNIPNLRKHTRRETIYEIDAQNTDPLYLEIALAPEKRESIFLVSILVSHPELFNIQEYIPYVHVSKSGTRPSTIVITLLPTPSLRSYNNTFRINIMVENETERETTESITLIPRR